jgi:hypothetical protein
MPIVEIASWIPGESKLRDILPWGLLPATIILYPRAVDVFEVGLSVLAGIDANDHLSFSPLYCYQGSTIGPNASITGAGAREDVQN